MHLVSTLKFKFKKIIGSRIRLNHRLYAQCFRVHFFSVTSLTFFTQFTFLFSTIYLAVWISLRHWHVIISTPTSCNILDFHPYNIKTVLSVNEGIPGKVESSPFNVLSQVPQVLIMCNTRILKLMWESMYILLEMPGSKKKLFILRWLFMKDLWNVSRHWSNQTIGCYQILFICSPLTNVVS